MNISKHDFPSAVSVERLKITKIVSGCGDIKYFRKLFTVFGEIEHFGEAFFGREEIRKARTIIPRNCFLGVEMNFSRNHFPVDRLNF